MKGTSMRFVRVALVAAVAWAAYVALEPYGLAWALLPVAAVALGVLGGARLLRGRRVRAREAREAAWSEAVLDGARRPAALAELEAAMKQATTLPERARLEVLFAELLDAEGRTKDAEERLAALAGEPLDPIDAGVVRHARATLALRQGDAERARALLSGRAPRTGSEELDLRLSLLDAAADCELGDAARGLETAARVQKSAAGDEALTTEARVVRAAALDALGERADALALVRTLPAEVAEVLARIGPPRIRALVEEVLA